MNPSTPDTAPPPTAVARARRESLLPDGLVQDLVAAGTTDVLVGLVTSNHATTIEHVVAEVLRAFSGPLMRQRTLLVNLDHGSTDGTPELVSGARQAGGVAQAIQHPLRTVHRIARPYHGVPGRGAALRTLLAAADLLGVQALVLIDPENAHLTADEVAALARAVLDGGHDFVKCAPARSPWEAPLVTQLVRPLLQAHFGRAVQEPLDLQFAGSRRWVATLRPTLTAESVDGVGEVDVRMVALALHGDFSVAELPVARPPVAVTRAPPLADVFRDVVSATFEALETPRQATRPPPVTCLGPAPEWTTRQPHIDVHAAERAFVEGVAALRPLLEPMLSPARHQDLERASQSIPPRLDETTWVHLVCEFASSAHNQRLPPEQLAQALMPLYEGRVATFFRETQGLPVERAAQSLIALRDAFAATWSNGPAGAEKLR